MLKLFCNCCHGFIKELEPIGAGKLTGLEVCEVCSEKMSSSIEDIEKMSKRAQFAIQKKADRAKADIEMALSRVLKKE